MADEVTIRGANAPAKLRSPIGVLLLSIVTIGIYGIYWWYAINREMADLGRGRNTQELGDNPVMSVLAATLGVLILVPPFVTMWTTCKRIERAQSLELGSNNFSPILAFVLAIVGLGFISVVLMQSNLNQVWERHRSGAAA